MAEETSCFTLSHVEMCHILENKYMKYAFFQVQDRDVAVYSFSLLKERKKDLIVVSVSLSLSLARSPPRSLSLSLFSSSFTNGPEVCHSLLGSFGEV